MTTVGKAMSSSLHPSDADKPISPPPSSLVVDVREAVATISGPIDYCGEVARAVYSRLYRSGRYKHHRGSDPPTNHEVSDPYTLGHRFVRVGDWIIDAWSWSGAIEPKIWHVNDPVVIDDISYKHAFDERVLYALEDQFLEDK